MSTPRTIRCSSCSQLLKVAPNPRPIQVKCPGCQSVLQVPGSAPTPTTPRPNTGVDFRDLPPPQVLREAVQQPRGYKLPVSSPEPITTPSRAANPGPSYLAATQRSKKRIGMPTWLYILLGSFMGVPLLCCGGLGVVGFVAKNFASKIVSPVMAFQARDDDNVPYSDAETFIAKMKQDGKDIHFVEARHGGHYNSTISSGIPTAIEWLKTK